MKTEFERIVTREIKFRIWDNRQKSFIIHNNSIHFDLWDWATQMSDCLIYPIDHVIFQQYTGIKDINNKEIYEGDIVSWSEDQGWEDGRTFTGFYEVKWNENTLRFDFYEIHGNVWWELADTQFNCVVGNIFENPELLK